MSDIDDSIPCDLEAEQAVLGSMMLSPAALADCMEILKARDFVRGAHKEIFAAVAAISGRGENADPITVKAQLEARGTLHKAGGAPYLHTLLAAVPAVVNAPWYAKRVRDCAVRWRLAEAAQEIRAAALRGSADVTDRIDAAYKVLDEAAGIAAPPAAKSIAELIGPALEAIEKGPDGQRGVTTGWTDLDALVPGFRGGEMVTIGGRPGMGKSVVMVNLALHAGLDLGLPVLLCTLEMKAQECMERVLACRAEVDLRAIRSGTLTERDWSRVNRLFPRLSACENVLVNDYPYLSLLGIRSDLRAMRRAGMPAGLVVIDYLGLVNGSSKSESREREISEFSRGVKLLAKEFDVPVVVGSQLNRGPEMRSDHRPLPADLRDSGSVEQDSDIVILLFREDAYEKESPHAGEIDLIVAKNRQGAQGVVTLAFRGHYSMIRELYRPPAVREELPERAA